MIQAPSAEGGVIEVVSDRSVTLEIRCGGKLLEISVGKERNSFIEESD